MTFEYTLFAVYLALGLATILLLRLADRNRHRTAGMGFFFFLIEIHPIFWLLLAASWPMWAILFFYSRPSDDE